jgi:hypothetical protein
MGLAFDDFHLFIADSGNNRVVVAEPSFGAMATSGEAGSALGQFRGPVHVSVSDRGICVVDAGNNRIQFFDPIHGGEGGSLAPFNPRFAISAELGLNHPKAAAWAKDFLEEKIYIADTSNDRVILVRFPGDNPEAVWDQMKDSLRNGNIEGAISCFASVSKDKYRQTFLAIELKDLIQDMSQIPPITPITIESDRAQYRFDQNIQGHTITFPIEFVKENGKWKIMEY